MFPVMSDSSMQNRKICFVGTAPGETEFYEDRFGKCDLTFVDYLDDVPEDTEVLSIFIFHKITRDFLSSHPAVRLIATRSTRCEHIDLAACREAGIRAVNVTGYGQNSVAEHTFALLLSISRRLKESEEAARTGRVRPERLCGFDLRGKTLGVVGTGRAGTHVIRIARGFGMRVVAYDSRPNPVMADVMEFTYGDLDFVLREADVLTLHVPLNEQTYHLLNQDTFAKCKPGVILINTARGFLIDTEALTEALESGQVGGAGLDVIEEETVFRGGATAVLGQQISERLRSAGPDSDRVSTSPERLEEISRYLANSALLRRPEVIFTPHVAYNSAESVASINESTAANIKAFLKGENLESSLA
jgi:D-lactate dehydrogenase